MVVVVVVVVMLVMPMIQLKNSLFIESNVILVVVAHFPGCPTSHHNTLDCVFELWQKGVGCPSELP